ncbi:hypothetical protein Tco_0205486 [Tanacetum coccineum]
MEISIADQIALDDALVAPANRLKIGKCNLRLSSDVTSKEATLQVVYDVLKLTPFYKAFQVTADVPEIYMQEFWVSAYDIHNSDILLMLIFGTNMAEATSLIDILVTTIVEPSFFAPTNHPPTPNPLFIRLQQPPILTPATTPSSSLQNLPDFGSLFGFDYRLKALEDNFSELKQTNQYAKALSSIPSIVDQYLANKCRRK